MTAIKFCGLRRPEDVAGANEIGPDYVGFVFWEGSRRYITPEQAATLRRDLNEDIIPVGVFRDADIGTIRSICETGCISMVQLHGNETETAVRKIRETTGAEVIRAFVIRSKADVEKALSTDADHVMLDGGTGSGTSFDWSLLEGFGRPFFLAGGLTPENVGGAIERLGPFAVDTSSGIETEGNKDPTKMRRFAEAVAAADLRRGV